MTMTMMTKTMMMVMKLSSTGKLLLKGTGWSSRYATRAVVSFLLIGDVWSHRLDVNVCEWLTLFHVGMSANQFPPKHPKWETNKFQQTAPLNTQHVETHLFIQKRTKLQPKPTTGKRHGHLMGPPWCRALSHQGPISTAADHAARGGGATSSGHWCRLVRLRSDLSARYFSIWRQLIGKLQLSKVYQF